MRFRAAVTVVALSLPLVAAGETFRCGKWIINEETTLQELLHKCGQPSSKVSRVEDVRAHNINGGMAKVGETVIETWTFDRGSRASPMVVTIIDGQIKSIERSGK